jgi:hypothetical protein
MANNPYIGGYDPEKAAEQAEKIRQRQNAPYREHLVEESGQPGEVVREVTQEDIDKKEAASEHRLKILEDAKPEPVSEQGQQAVNDRIMQYASGVVHLDTEEVTSPSFEGVKYQIPTRHYTPFAKPEVSEVERITAELEREEKKGRERNPATMAALKDELRYAKSLEHQQLQELDDSLSYEDEREQLETELDEYTPVFKAEWLDGLTWRDEDGTEYTQGSPEGSAELRGRLWVASTTGRL